VSYLAGLVPYHKKPVLSLKHLIYFGIRSYEEEEDKMLKNHKIPFYKSEDCMVERLD
jgi:arginase family enzyme